MGDVEEESEEVVLEGPPVVLLGRLFIALVQLLDQEGKHSLEE